MPNTDRLNLVALTDRHLGFLHQLACDPEIGPRWKYRGTTPSPEQVWKDCHEGVLCTFTITLAGDRPIGLVSAYGASRAGYCYVATVLCPSFVGSGLGLLSTAMFLDYLFANFPLRKIYLEIGAYNLSQMVNLLNRFFDFEGKLAEHEYFSGRYHDLLIFSMTRERFEATRPFLDRVFNAHGSPTPHP